MNADELRTRYCLEISDLPNQAGMNVVTIQRIDTEYYDSIENGRKVGKCRHNLYLREFTLPLRLNNTRIDIIESMYGKETDGWIGHRIGLYVGASQSFGKTKPTLMVHIQSADSVPPCIPTGRYGTPASALAPAMGPPPLMLPPSGQVPPMQAPAATAAVTAFDVAPIGAKNAEAFKLALAEQGANSEDCLYWMRRTHEDAYERTHGRPIEEWPRGIAPVMQQFLRDWQVTKNVPAQLTPGPPAMPLDAGKPDIPF